MLTKSSETRASLYHFLLPKIVIFELLPFDRAVTFGMSTKLEFETSMSSETKVVSFELFA
jgi:hypothetical protein